MTRMYRVRLLGPTAFWRTLRFRFALWVSLLLLLAQLLVGAFVYVRLQDRLLMAIDETLWVNAVQIHALSEAQPDGLTLPTHTDDSALTTDLQGQLLTARILSSTGEILQAYGIYRDIPVDSRIISAAQAHHDSLITIRDPDDADENIRVLAIPIIEDDQLVGVVEVTQRLESVEDTLEQLTIVFQLGVPLSVLIAGVGGYVLAARALARVDHITAMARQISADDLTERLHLPATNDEIGRLAQTFDMMLERLHAGFQRERQFTSDASHELRTPLAAMRTILDLTRSRPRTTIEYERALDDLAEEAIRLQGLVTDLLTLARNETRYTNPYVRVDVSILLHDLCDSLRPLATNKGLKLACAVQDELSLLGDHDQLIRLFVNLMDNAIKFTDQGEIIVNGEQRPNSGLTITVMDTGCGIAAEHLASIFDRFYRVETSRSTAGTGLGLALAQSIAAAHGGTIDVDSKPGQGTTFSISFEENTQLVRFSDANRTS